MDDQFHRTVEGRVPISTNMGGYKFWTRDTIPYCKEDCSDGGIKQKEASTDTGNIPRPDRSLTVLKWCSILGGIFGADHFYLRSPKTATLKLLTLGGAGLWWLWDIIQLYSEKERVLNYGMTSIFDIFQGIGQGMITDKNTFYEQKNSFVAWVFLVLFGFTGLDMMYLGKLGRAGHTFIVFGLALILITAFVPLTFGFFHILWLVFLGIVIGPFALGLCIMYVTSIWNVIVDPEHLFEKGIPKVDSKFFFDPSGYVVGDVRDNFSIATLISGKELLLKFWIQHKTEEVHESTTSTNDTWFVPVQVFIGLMTAFFQWIALKMWEGLKMIFPALAAAERIQKQGMDRLKKMEEEAKKAADRMNQGIATVVPSASASASASALGASPLKGLQVPGVPTIPNIPKIPKIPKIPGMKGGSIDDISTEGMVLGATVIALIAGGGIKVLVDSLIHSNI